MLPNSGRWEMRPEDLEALSELGASSSGTVTKVKHIPTGRLMAKKIFHIDANPSVRKQILRELQILHDCLSPNIVSFYGAIIEDADLFMLIEYCEGGSLDELYNRNGPIDEKYLSKISKSVLNGMSYLYEVHRIIHRGIKPSNILITKKGEIKLCDFGASRVLINSSTDSFSGSSLYMSPERIQGASYSVKADVWSLGITIMELALGRFPYQNMTFLETLAIIVNEPAPILPDEYEWSEEIKDFLKTCLKKEVAERPRPNELLRHPFVQLSSVNLE